MSNSDKKNSPDADGMAFYEFLVDNIGGEKELIEHAVENIINADTSGQFSASAARFLAAIDADSFALIIDTLLKSAIEKDREKQYLQGLLPAIWGEDYMNRADELRDKDDNFRRIFKRIHPVGII